MKDVDPVFLRSKFLLRQKHFALSEKYDVWDEGGQPLLYVERPAMFWRSLSAALAAAVVFVGFVALGGWASTLPEDQKGNPLVPGFILGGLVLGVVGAAATAVACGPKRHVHVYRDDAKRERLLTVEQDRKWTPIRATYTVKDAGGEVLARLSKNYVYNLFRKRWRCHAPDGTLLSLVLEDSLVRALLRRFLGSFFGLLRTNFVLLKGEDEGQVIGEFNRKLTLLDRYVLDLTADEAEHLDKRVALAIGVMLDTGERR